MAAITICSDFGAEKNKVTVSIVSSSACREVMGPVAMILAFWMLSYKPTFSLSSFTFIKRLFSSPSLSAIRVVLSAYLRLLIFLPAILIPVCTSSILAFCMMYSAYKLNKQGDNTQPWHTPFQFGTSPLFHVRFCFFLTCIQIFQEADKVVWHSNVLKNFPQFIVIYTVKGFGIINKAEVDIFLGFSCFFNDQVDVGNLISGSSALCKSSLNICKFMLHILSKPGLENFEYYFTSMWDECNCVAVWTFFGIALLRDWNKNWPFSVLWPLLSFPNLLVYWVQHFNMCWGIWQIFVSSNIAMNLKLL